MAAHSCLTVLLTVSALYLMGTLLTSAHAQTAGQEGGVFLSARTEPYYGCEAGAVVRDNGERFHNRPLYCNHIRTYVLAGDQPMVRLVQDPCVFGNMQFAVRRGGETAALQAFSDRQTRFEPNRVTWVLQHDAWPGLRLVLRAVPMEQGPGMVLRLTAEGTEPGDVLLWTFGEAVRRTPGGTPNIAWDLDPLGHPDLLDRGFVPEDCRDDHVELTVHGLRLWPDSTPEPEASFAEVQCSASSEMRLVDARDWTVPPSSSGEPELPAAAGTCALEGGEIYWRVRVVQEKDSLASQSLPEAYRAGWARAKTLGERVTVRTPEPALNAAAAFVSAALDGVYIPPVYNHGGMLWNVPFPGWRTLYGPTAYGWIEHVKAQARYYIASQVTEDTPREPHSSPQLGLGQESRESRFYGKGHIAQDTSFYNFQSQFFDMLIHAWRWTGDPELEAILRPALALHLEWQQACFDPDDDGLYESYINCWPTDCVWFNGGGGPEETAYAYTGHLAAADMARNAGYPEAEARHRSRAARIRESFMSQLWLPGRGYPGAYRDQLGLRRVHEDAWLYGIFCPIDADLLDPVEALQALYYTEWGLERVDVPFGGVRCWTSNWVPSVWSVRELFPGDNYHLALAYYQANQPDEAWELLHGNMLAYALDGGAPGSLGTPNGGTDFSDVSSMFARVVVEGLYGVAPDYPNGVVRVTPAFPLGWPEASIETPEFALTFARTTHPGEGEDRYLVRLPRAAKLEFGAYLSARYLEGAYVDGVRIDAKTRPVVGRTLVSVTVDGTEEVEIVLKWRGSVEAESTTALAAYAGETITLSSDAGDITRVQDPQHCLAAVSDDLASARVAETSGSHLVLAEVSLGQLQRLERIALSVREKRTGPFLLTEVPKNAAWVPVDLSPVLNGDIRAIYQQTYASPRPSTCSVRLGSDGYSPWCFYYWGKRPPAITLDRVADLLEGPDRLVTPRGVPFLWPEGPNNIAFTSRWDNWPTEVAVPVNAAGRAAWFLVCGSTNPMQTRIANAVVRMRYADGAIDSLELVPPLNFWTLCPLGGTDYDYERDGFCLPETPPMTVQLGENCRAILLGYPLREGKQLAEVGLETLSEEVVVGLMGLSIMR